MVGIANLFGLEKYSKCIFQETVISSLGNYHRNWLPPFLLACELEAICGSDLSPLSLWRIARKLKRTFFSGKLNLKVDVRLILFKYRQTLVY